MTDNTEATTSVRIGRKFGAPIDIIWKMWAEPEHFKAWYGPQGATIPVAEFDVRVGGRRFVGMEMKTPNGSRQMWFTGEHVAVDEPTVLAYTESMSDSEGNVQTPASMGMPDGHPTTTEVHVSLEANGDHTTMTLTHHGVPAGSPGEMGWRMAIEKLEAYLNANTDQ
jgi:uncharacterized protein YndB with AHSA1/START domain